MDGFKVKLLVKNFKNKRSVILGLPFQTGSWMVFIGHFLHVTLVHFNRETRIVVTRVVRVVVKVTLSCLINNRIITSKGDKSAPRLKVISMRKRLGSSKGNCINIKNTSKLVSRRIQIKTTIIKQFLSKSAIIFLINQLYWVLKHIKGTCAVLNT